MNEAIRNARDIALDRLKPSQSQIEHGMELHRHSLVCESYGFSPRAAVDGDAVRAAVEAGASEVELKDMMEEMRMTRQVTHPQERQEFQMAWEASGVTCIFQNAGEEGNSVAGLLKRFGRYTYVTDHMKEFVCKAVTPNDIVAAKEQGKRCLYLTTNGVPLPQGQRSVEDEMAYIRVFFQLGCRMMHLTYNRRNLIGDGCAELGNAGLSDFGRAVVAEMNRVGIIVDVAHSGWQTSLEAAQISEKPMVASHSGCAALNPHHRCKPDEVIRAIVDTGGYIGICCISRFLGGNGDINRMLDHIDYVVQHFGIDHVAIGTDLAYESANAVSEWPKIPRRGPSRNQWEGLWRPEDADPEWRSEKMRRMQRSMAWTNWPLFTVGLVQRGYSDDDIQKILGGNVLRVARAVWPEGLAM